MILGMELKCNAVLPITDRNIFIVAATEDDEKTVHNKVKQFVKGFGKMPRSLLDDFLDDPPDFWSITGQGNKVNMEIVNMGNDWNTKHVLFYFDNFDDLDVAWKAQSEISKWFISLASRVAAPKSQRLSVDAKANQRKSVMLQQNVNLLQEFDSTDEDESDDDDLEAELAKLN